MKKAVKKVTKTKQIENNEISELKKLTYIFGSIIGIFLIFYGIAYLKANKPAKNDEDTVRYIQYEEILISNLLMQNADSYYVMTYNKEEDYNGIYSPYIKKYKTATDALPIFYVNLNNTFNKNFKSEHNYFSITNISDLKVKDDVLFLIKDGKISKYYIGEEISKILLDK